MKILILCNDNSRRSQMAEGYLKHLNSGLEIFSAGTAPDKKVDDMTVKVMDEIGIDISQSYPKNVAEFLNQNFDYVITVCDESKSIIPVFSGKTRETIHFSHNDPLRVTGGENEKIEAFRKIRDEIIEDIRRFYLFKIT